MTKHPLFIAVPCAVAILLVLTPSDALATVALAGAAIAAAAIGTVLAWNTRPRQPDFGRGRVFHVAQSEASPNGGRLLAVRFAGRTLLLSAHRDGHRLLAESIDAATSAAGDETGAPETDSAADHREPCADYEIPRAASPVATADPLARYRALAGRPKSESTA